MLWCVRCFVLECENAPARVLGVVALGYFASIKPLKVLVLKCAGKAGKGRGPVRCFRGSNVTKNDCADNQCSWGAARTTKGSGEDATCWKRGVVLGSFGCGAREDNHTVGCCPFDVVGLLTDGPPQVCGCL